MTLATSTIPFLSRLPPKHIFLLSPDTNVRVTRCLMCA